MCAIEDCTGCLESFIIVQIWILYNSVLDVV
jgi:hypothetical protein